MTRKPKGYWTFERCKAEALNYQTKKDFRVSFAYWKAHTKGWIEEICDHMEPMGNREFRYVYEIAMHSLRIVYVGLTQNVKERLKNHSHKGTALGLIKSGCEMVLLSGLLPKAQASEYEKAMVKHYTKIGYVVLNRITAGGLGGGRKIWTVGKCLLESQRYKTRTEFYRGSPGAYEAAKEHGIYELCCFHMGKRKHKPITWNFQNCQKEALKYDHRTEFNKGSAGAYQASAKQGWLDMICSHMTRKRNHK